MALITFENSGLPQDPVLKNLFNALSQYSFGNGNLRPGAVTTMDGRVTPETLASQKRLHDSIESGFNTYIQSLNPLTAPDVDQNASIRAIGTLMLEEAMQTAEAYSGRSSAEYRPVLAAEFKAHVAGSSNTAYFEQEIEDYAQARTSPEIQAEIDARQKAETPENVLMGAMHTIWHTKGAIRWKDAPDDYPPKKNLTAWALKGFESVKEDSLPKSVYATVLALNTQLRNG